MDKRKLNLPVRYESSVDLQNAWLRSAGLDLDELAALWGESIESLAYQMRHAESELVKLKCAIELKRMLPEFSRLYADLKPKEEDKNTIDLKGNPWQEDDEK